MRGTCSAWGGGHMKGEQGGMKSGAGWVERFDISNIDLNPKSVTKSNPKSDG